MKIVVLYTKTIYLHTVFLKNFINPLIYYTTLLFNQEEKEVSGYSGKGVFKAKQLKRGYPASDQ